MRIPFRKRSTSGLEDFFGQYSSVITASLVTVILVSCGAEVAENQALKEAENARQTAIIDSLPDLSNGPPPLSPEAPRTRQEPNLALGDGASANTNSPANAAERVFLSVEQPALQSQGPQSVFIASDRSTAASLSYMVQAEQQDWTLGPRADRENYLEVDENAVKLVSEHPVSTFSIDVDTAGYSNIRRMIMQEGRLPPHDAVRLEEMINYFSYDYPQPASLDEPLTVYTELASSPWNPANKLLMVGVQGFEPPTEERPPANLVFLVDVSGSMSSPDKLGLVQQSLKLLTDRMEAQDRIALVVYAGAAGMVLDSTAGDDKARIKQAIDSLQAGGSTNGAAGIQLAYQIAEQNRIEGGINRVIIASDGDLNVGVTDIDDLKELIGKKRDKGIALTTLGFGTGNYNYSLMEQIADVGNGNAAYIDSLNEARKVLVEEMNSTLLTIAKDVKIQIEFNPATVKEYRLLGYENRLLNREDFVNDKVDAGEIGAGHTVTALYEITPTGSGGGLIPDSRYSSNRPGDEDALVDELAFIRIRHKPADGDTSTEYGRPVLQSSTRELAASSDSFRFAAAVAGFGQLLRGGRYTGSFDYDGVLELARGARGADDHGYRSELLNLVEMAKLL